MSTIRLPRFSGKDDQMPVTSWFNRIKAIGFASKWDEATTLQHLLTSLDSLAQLKLLYSKKDEIQETSTILALAQNTLGVSEYYALLLRHGGKDTKVRDAACSIEDILKSVKPENNVNSIYRQHGQC